MSAGYNCTAKTDDVSSCNFTSVLMLFSFQIELKPANIAINSQICLFTFFLPAALRAAQTCRYLVYSEADFEVFRPTGATCCTDGGEIWHGGGDLRPPSMQRQGCRTPKIEIFTQI